MKITVTQVDIHRSIVLRKEGLTPYSSHCPIAEAIRREHPDAREIRVPGHMVSWFGQWGGRYHAYMYKLPKKAMTFIDQFDSKRLPNPGPITFWTLPT